MKKSGLINIANDIFVDCSSQMVECGFCNTIHWSGEGDFEEGELENLQRNTKDFPLRFREHENFIRWGTVFDNTFVPICGCIRMIRTLKTLWNERVSIVRFFKAITQKNWKSAHDDVTLLNDV